jgi:ankyrin repeat protein
LETWRPEHPEEAVLSTCSTLIAVIDDKGSKIVQFSHFSVKEFLTSGRLQASEVGSIRDYYIPLEPAHTTLARTCLTVLLQFDENVDKRRLATFPLAFYAAQHWVDHAKFGDVSSQITDAMEDLFDPRKPYLAAWTWVHDVDRGDKRSIGSLDERPSPPAATPLYYLALYGFDELAKRHIIRYPEDLNIIRDSYGTPLNAASLLGHIEVTRVLLDHGADANAKTKYGASPLYTAYQHDHFDVMELLLERGARTDTQDGAFGTLLHDAAYHGHTEVTQLLLRHGVNMDARGDVDRTPLHFASSFGHYGIVQLLLDHRAEVDPESGYHETPLWAASDKGHLEIVRLLLDHGADVHFRKNQGQTAFQKATANGHHDVAQLLLEHGAVRE